MAKTKHFVPARSADGHCQDLLGIARIDFADPRLLIRIEPQPRV
jgi:hypothetical protein